MCFFNYLFYKRSQIFTFCRSFASVFMACLGCEMFTKVRFGWCSKIVRTTALNLFVIVQLSPLSYIVEPLVCFGTSTNTSILTLKFHNLSCKSRVKKKKKLKKIIVLFQWFLTWGASFDFRRRKRICQTKNVLSEIDKQLER